MRLWTTVLQQASKSRRAFSSSSGRGSKISNNKSSLALSVYFKQPELGMKEYEILSRASAFLLGVDMPSSPSAASGSGTEKGPYGFLEASQRRRDERQFQQTYKYSPVSGSHDDSRQVADLGWLEFVPREVRPNVHIVSSSHVLAPFLWQDYYPQEWLKRVRAEHCTYSLEVFDPEKPEEALAKLALNKDVFHHPEGRDIALIHFQEEQSSLKLLKSLGVNTLHLRDPDKLYQKHEEMVFDGFVVSEPNAADNEDYSDSSSSSSSSSDSRTGDDENEDYRIFYPYKEQGKLSFHTNDRFFASTPEPLPEGLCGAPVLDKDGDLCGTVEGIVPVDHKDKRLAGNAAFMPSHVMKVFVDFVERGLVEQMMPKELFKMVVATKETNSIGGLGGVLKADGETLNQEGDGDVNWEEAHNVTLETLKRQYGKEDMDKIMKTIEGERKEVMEIFDREGGDLDQIIHQVRSKTMLQIQEMVQDEYRKAQTNQDSSSTEESPSKSTA